MSVPLLSARLTTSWRRQTAVITKLTRSTERHFAASTSLVKDIRMATSWHRKDPDRNASMTRFINVVLLANVVTWNHSVYLHLMSTDHIRVHYAKLVLVDYNKSSVIAEVAVQCWTNWTFTVEWGVLLFNALFLWECCRKSLSEKQILWPTFLLLIVWI